jgi:putative ABC transport system permease protein
MIISFIKIGIRNLIKNKVYGFINILGLAVGLAGCILIGLFVEDEIAYDKFHENSENIYRLALERVYPTHSTYYAITPHSFGDILGEELPEIEQVVRLFNFVNPVVIRYENEKGEELAMEEKHVLLADSNFFKVFTLPLLKGDRETVMRGANKLVMTESTAKKYFGDTDPINKILVTGAGEFTVSGVCRDLPENSHFKFDIIGSLNTLDFFNTMNFTSFSAYQYIVLKKGADPELLEEKLPDIVIKYAGPQIQENLSISYDEYIAAGNGYNYFLQPLTSIHLHSQLENEMQVNGNIAVVYIFISISLFILVIACINFMNLATARSSERAKEIGIRKTLGSSRKKIIVQITLESIIISLISLVIGVLIVSSSLPYFNQLANKNLELNLESIILPVLLGFAILVGILSGLYPAIFLSAFKPSVVLKGRFATGTKGIWLRNSLVIVQFFISIVLIAGTVLIYKQLNFLQNRQLGFDKDNVIIIERAFALDEQFDAFKDELRTYSFVKSLGVSSSIPGKDQFFGAFFQVNEGSEALTTKNMIIDEDYIETLNLEMLMGRDFDRNFEDSLSLIINETAVKAFGIEDPVGATLTTPAAGEVPAVTFTIVGVIKDFNFQSLHTQITPLTLWYANNNAQYINIKINSRAFSSDLSELEALWKKYVPDEPFKFSFLDQNLKTLYEAEQDSGMIMSIFSILAIIIASVGLFGLAAYTTIQRKKEIGVRKVMGSSVGGIIALLSRDFARLIIISFLIAVPLVYLGMNKWLEGFAYKVKIASVYPLVIFIAGIISLGIAFLTVSYHSIKAAVTNPVDSLRYE